MKVLKWILIGVAVLAVIGVIIMLIPILSAMFNPKGHILDGGDMENKSYLVSVTYSEAGDMSGGSVYMKLFTEEDGKVWLEVSECKAAGCEDITETYELDRTAIDEFNALYDEMHMSRCVDLPDSELMLLDAAVCSVMIEFADRKIRFNSNQEFPEECIGAISSTYTLLRSFIPENNEKE